MPFVIITTTVQASGEEHSHTQEVVGPTLTIGGGEEADLPLHDPSVGAARAVIQELNGVYILRHVGDVGRTFVNDKPVTEVILTKKGTVRIGRVTLTFSRPIPSAPLTIEYRIMPETEQTRRIDAAATLVLRVSPMAAPSGGGDPDATQTLPALSGASGRDPDKTQALPAIGAPAAADPDATQKIAPIPASQSDDSDEPTDDPDKTLTIPPRK